MSDNFKKRSMGLVCDFAADINKVYPRFFHQIRCCKRFWTMVWQTRCCFTPSVYLGHQESAGNFPANGCRIIEAIQGKKDSNFQFPRAAGQFRPLFDQRVAGARVECCRRQAFRALLRSLCGVFGKTVLENWFDFKINFRKRLAIKQSCTNMGRARSIMALSRLSRAAAIALKFSAKSSMPA